MFVATQEDQASSELFLFFDLASKLEKKKEWFESETIWTRPHILIYQCLGHCIEKETHR